MQLSRQYAKHSEHRSSVLRNARMTSFGVKESLLRLSRNLLIARETFLTFPQSPFSRHSLRSQRQTLKLFSRKPKQRFKITSPSKANRSLDPNSAFSTR